MKTFAKSIFFLLLSICTYSYGNSQIQSDFTPDPLNKPKIWAQLTHTPHQQSLWVQYFGKPWVSLSVVERERVKEWRTILSRKRHSQALQSNHVASSSEELWDDAMADASNNRELQAKVEMEKAQFHRLLASHVMPENELLAELKQNVEANFIILEDIYRAEFAELGEEYVDYETKYPQGKFSKIRWVEEQSERLQQLKQNYLAELRSKAVH